MGRKIVYRCFSVRNNRIVGLQPLMWESEPHDSVLRLTPFSEVVTMKNREYFLFPDVRQAVAAANELREQGVPKEDMRAMAKPDTGLGTLVGDVAKPLSDVCCRVEHLR